MLVSQNELTYKKTKRNDKKTKENIYQYDMI